MNGMEKNGLKTEKKIKKLNEKHILDLFISVPIRDMKKENS